MMNLICLMDHNLFQTFETSLSMLFEKRTIAVNPPVQIYPNKIKKRNVFKIKAGYKLKLFTPETMKLLGSAKKRC